MKIYEVLARDSDGEWSDRLFADAYQGYLYVKERNDIYDRDQARYNLHIQKHGTPVGYDFDKHSSVRYRMIERDVIERLDKK